MTQNLNQFTQTPEQGQLAFGAKGLRLAGIVDPASTSLAGIVPATAVKQTSNAGSPIITFDKAAETDNIFGFVMFSNKNNTYVAGQPIEIASAGNIMYMTAGANIAAGAEVEINASANTVITSAGTNKIIGRNLVPVLSGALAQILIESPKINQV